MTDLDRRLRDLERRAAVRRRAHDARFWIGVALQVEMMHQSVQIFGNGAAADAARAEQRARLGRLEAACKSGNVEPVIDDLKELGFAGPEPWRPIQIPDTTTA